MLEHLRNQIFICFSSKDRYTIAEPIVYHLRNYGFNVWYDRFKLLLGDNREKKNLQEGAKKSSYIIMIISHNTTCSLCAMEEMAIAQQRYENKSVCVFPILYEISPTEIPPPLQWVKKLIFYEATRSSGTGKICNHIACRITQNLLEEHLYQKIDQVLQRAVIPSVVRDLLETYTSIDQNNLNSRVSLLYAIQLVFSSLYLKEKRGDPIAVLVSDLYRRLINETKLNLKIDYREIRLLENGLCLLINTYLDC